MELRFIMIRFYGLIIVLLLLSCGDNPLGDTSSDSSFLGDSEAPTSPSSLNLTGNATLSSSPTINWTASTDNKAVTSYEIALGSSSGGTELLDYTDIGFVTSYQFTSLSPTLTPATEYFISIRALDEASNKSPVTTQSFYSQGLSLSGGAFQYPDTTFATSCLSYLNSPRYNSEGDGLYWVDPDGSGGDAQIQVRCDMTRNGGGWTLIANRRLHGSNIDTCQTGLDTFFQNTCGSPSNIGSADSYSIGNTARRENIITNGEWLFVQYDAGDTEDSDDAYIIHHNGNDLFFSSTGTINRTAVTQVCDINNAACDSTGVEFIWTGDGYFSGASCSAGYSAPGGTYYGNYGYCHNGAVGLANSLYGNRTGYNETKLWGHPSGGGSYYERIFIR